MKEGFRALHFQSEDGRPQREEFPINLLKLKKLKFTTDDDEDKKQGLDPYAINSRLADLVRFAHGSLEPKPKLIEDFNEKFPECSKNSVERKLKEYFVKDQRGEDPKQRYYASEDILKMLETDFPGGLANPELTELAKNRV